MKTEIKSKYSQFLIICLMTISLALGACGGGGDVAEEDVSDISPPPEPINPFAYPTKQDDHEGASGDNTAATAGSIAIGATQDRTLWPARDIDWVAVELVADTDYEFSTSKLCATCDTYMYLYDTDGTTLLDSTDDWIGYDSTIQFTPTVAGTYYIEVRNYDEDYGVAHYTLDARLLVDNDADGFSNYHDCDDSDANIYPWQTEIAGDAIDQNCSGTDWPLGNVADSAESDDSAATAVAMYESQVYIYEIIWLQAMYTANTRTIAPAGDIDYFSITIPANSAGNVELINSEFVVTVSVTSTLYDSDGVTVLDTDVYLIENPTASSKTFYVSYEATVSANTGAYLPVFYSLGTDLDGDGYYSQDWDEDRDCNDGNAEINPGITEVLDDSIDSNCDGADNT